MPWLEAVKFADSEDGIRSEFIKTPCGTRHTPLWDLIKTKEKSKCVTDQSIFLFNLATRLMLCTKIKTLDITFIH
jgi:L-rhamnose mutarotase